MAAAMEHECDRDGVNGEGDRDTNNKNSVYLWMKNEPFMFGVVAPQPSVKLDYKYLQRILLYCITKKDCCYEMSYKRWTHIICQKLKLCKELALFYFQTFNSLLNFQPKERVSRDKSLMYQFSHGSGEIKVPTLELLIFMFIQHVASSSRPRSLVQKLNDFHFSPSFLCFVMKEHRRTDELNYLFVRDKLDDLLGFFVSWSEATKSLRLTEKFICLEVVKALNFIFGAYSESARSAVNLDEAATACGDVTGYSSSHQIFHLDSLLSWMKSKLQVSPFGLKQCVLTGLPLSRLTSCNCTVLNSSDGKIITNQHTAPDSSKLTVLHKVSNDTVVRVSGSTCIGSVHIMQCNLSFIYMLSAMRSCKILMCVSSEVVVGAVEGTLLVSECNGVIISGVCRRLVIRDCQGCTFFVKTASPPVLVGEDNDRIEFAPLNCIYPKLEDHMDLVGLDAGIDFWNDPLCIGRDGNPVESPKWKLLPPTKFYQMVPPVKMEGRTCSLPGGLPFPYSEVHCNIELRKEKRDVEFYREMKLKLHHKSQTWLRDRRYQEEMKFLQNL